MFEMNSRNKRFFDRCLIGYPITARFERISSNVTASKKGGRKKLAQYSNSKKKANKTSKNGLSEPMTSDFNPLTFCYCVL